MSYKLLLLICRDTLKEAENALTDYIDTLEKQGASLNYGHSVLKKIQVTLKLLGA